MIILGVYYGDRKTPIKTELFSVGLTLDIGVVIIHCILVICFACGVILPNAEAGYFAGHN